MVASFFGALTLAWQGITAEQAARERLIAALKLTREAMEVKFLAADFNGWQTAYAFDIIRGVSGATKDDAASRSKFLSSAAAFGAKLDAMNDERLTSAEKTDLTKSKESFQEFMRVDHEVIADYRRGDVQHVQHANELVLGREIEIFQGISQSITRLTESIVQRAAVASGKASAASSRSQWLFIGAGVATFLLAISSTLLLIRLVARETELLTQLDAITYLQRNEDNG